MFYDRSTASLKIPLKFSFSCLFLLLRIILIVFVCAFGGLSTLIISIAVVPEVLIIFCGEREAQENHRQLNHFLLSDTVARNVEDHQEYYHHLCFLLRSRRTERAPSDFRLPSGTFTVAYQNTCI